MAEEKVYAVYIMANTRRGVMYTGVTSEMPTHGLQHREGLLEGFTKRWGLKRLVWFEWHGEIHAAIYREKLIKRWRRQWKFALIEARNPNWVDLWPALMGQEPYPWESEEEAARAGVLGGPG